MARPVLIYDSSDSNIEGFSKRLASELGILGKEVAAENLRQLTAGFSQMMDIGVRTNWMIVVAHGHPGIIHFGVSNLFASGIPNVLGSKGFEDLFVPGAKVEFYGCELASKDMVGDGRKFMESFARTLLFKGGGRVSGWDVVGHFPIYLGTGVYHMGGNAHYVYIHRGGRTRYAIGDAVDSPAGAWTVKINNKSYIYAFDDAHNVDFYSFHEVPRTEGKGIWGVQDYGLWIRWVIGDRRWSNPYGRPDDEKEVWDWPLFSVYQSGKATGNVATFDVTAMRWVNIGESRR